MEKENIITVDIEDFKDSQHVHLIILMMTLR